MRRTRADRVLFLSSLLKGLGYLLFSVGLLWAIWAIGRTFVSAIGIGGTFLSMIHALLSALMTPSLAIAVGLSLLGLSSALVLLVDISENTWRAADALEGKHTVPTPRRDD